MHRPTRTVFTLSLFALIGCSKPAEPLDVPSPETQKYGPPAGTGGTARGPSQTHPGLADPGQPPVETDVPTGAGGSATVEEEPGIFSINPPRDLEDQPTAPEPSDVPAPATPPVDEPEEPGIGEP